MRGKKRDTAHIMGADGHFESYAILQSVPLASSLPSNHSPQTKLLSTLLHCSDFLLTRSRSFLSVKEGEASKNYSEPGRVGYFIQVTVSDY